MLNLYRIASFPLLSLLTWASLTLPAPAQEDLSAPSNPAPAATESAPSSRPLARACITEAIVGSDGLTSINPNLNRAKNLARQAAERANGGLNNYRAEAAMYGPIEGVSCVDNGDGTWSFRILGGVPGAEPTLKTVVVVNQNDGTSRIDYNGEIRNIEGDRPVAERPNQLTLVNPNSPSLGRARNLARQAAERANGGLGNYRAEPAMHGISGEISVQDTSDAWIFTFRGGRPGETDYSTESEVRVSKDFANITVDYNGPIRSASDS